MSNLEDLNISECFSDGKSTEIKSFFDSILRSCTQLRQIDISKNQLSRDNMNHFLNTIATQGSRIECVAMS